MNIIDIVLPNNQFVLNCIGTVPFSSSDHAPSNSLSYVGYFCSSYKRFWACELGHDGTADWTLALAPFNSDADNNYVFDLIVSLIERFIPHFSEFSEIDHYPVGLRECIISFIELQFILLIIYTTIIFLLNSPNSCTCFKLKGKANILEKEMSNCFILNAEVVLRPIIPHCLQ